MALPAPMPDRWLAAPVLVLDADAEAFVAVPDAESEAVLDAVPDAVPLLLLVAVALGLPLALAPVSSPEGVLLPLAALMWRSSICPPLLA